MHGSKHLRQLVLLLSLVGVMLAVAAPATANSKPTTGSRIGLYFPPTTFPANTPFYVKHGFACDSGDAGCISTQINGTSNCALYEDGVRQPSSVEVDAGGGGIAKWYLTNFPTGLPAGAHTFVGIWSLRGVVVQTLSATSMFTS